MTEPQSSLRKRLLFLAPLIVVGGLGLAFVFGLGRDPNALDSALIDRPAPNFILPALSGDGDVTLADLRAEGQPILLNFFASWCAPCRIEHPLLMDLAETYPVYGIAWKDAPERSQAFLNDLGDPFRAVGVDRENRAGIDYGLSGVPETFVIDSQGRVLHRHTGPLTDQVVAETLAPLLKK